MLAEEQSGPVACVKRPAAVLRDCGAKETENSGVEFLDRTGWFLVHDLYFRFE